MDTNIANGSEEHKSLEKEKEKGIAFQFLSEKHKKTENNYDKEGLVG